MRSNVNTLKHRIVIKTVVALFLASGAWALDIDEKLTLRLLKLSGSKKTVLINRGIEDGLAVGDHAKFYLTTGMVARGVVVKVSPARSVWSIYRAIDPTALVQNKVLNLKIATPVKITPDPSKMVMVEPIAVPGVDIPISPDAEALETAAAINDTSGESNDDIANISELEEQDIEQAAASSPDPTPAPILSPITSRKGTVWEVIGRGHFNSLTGKVDSDNSQNKNSGALGSYDLSLGLESYFFIPVLQQLSLQAFLNMGRSDTLSVRGGDSLESSFIGLGMAANYHFYHHPRDQRKPIAYASLGMGAGRARDKSTISVDSDTGDALFYQMGGGVKYYIGRWGGQVQLDYYVRQETYLFEDDTGPTTVEEKRVKTLSGPRLSLGLLYRF